MGFVLMRNSRLRGSTDRISGRLGGDLLVDSRYRCDGSAGAKRSAAEGEICILLHAGVAGVRRAGQKLGARPSVQD